MALDDFQAEVTYSALAVFTETSFGGEADVQALTILSGDAILEVSWNGTDVHKVMRPGEIDAAASWSDHPRSSVWLKKRSGVAGVVEVVAFREAGRQ